MSNVFNSVLKTLLDNIENKFNFKSKELEYVGYVTNGIIWNVISKEHKLLAIHDDDDKLKPTTFVMERWHENGKLITLASIQYGAIEYQHASDSGTCVGCQLNF